MLPARMTAAPAFHVRFIRRSTPLTLFVRPGFFAGLYPHCYRNGERGLLDTDRFCAMKLLCNPAADCGI
jgi:hypothetical protein